VHPHGSLRLGLGLGFDLCWVRFCERERERVRDRERARQWTRVFRASCCGVRICGHGKVTCTLNNAYFASARILFFFFYNVLRPWKRQGMMCFCFPYCRLPRRVLSRRLSRHLWKRKRCAIGAVVVENGSCKWG